MEDVILGMPAGSIIVMWMILLLVIPVLIVYLVGLWKLFKKAGRNGWEAIIPFYNTWVLAEISGVAWWYALIIILANLGIAGDGVLSSIASLASLVANFFICYNLSKKFNKDVGTAILTFLFGIVMIPVMGFSKSYQYDGNVFVSENGPFGDPSNVNNRNQGNQGFNSNGYSSQNYNSQSYNSQGYGFDNGVNGSDNGNVETRYCQYCGKQINAHAKYCGNCGSEIK